MKKNVFFAIGCLLLAAAGLFSYIHALDDSETAWLTAAPADSRESVDIPILMYHGITDVPSDESEYAISADRFESDLQKLRDNGFTTIFPSQLISYVKEGAKLPEKPVILSFDDGYCNNYTLAFPLLQKYNAKAVFALIGSESDLSSDEIYRNPMHCNMSWSEVAIMARSGLAEFASHTYRLHTAAAGGRKGADMIPGEAFADYRQVLMEDLSRNQELIAAAAGKAPQVFAWPYGAYPMDRSADAILKELGFDATFVSYQHTSTVRAGDPESLYGLGRYLRTPDFDINVLFNG